MTVKQKKDRTIKAREEKKQKTRVAQTLLDLFEAEVERGPMLKSKDNELVEAHAHTVTARTKGRQETSVFIASLSGSKDRESLSAINRGRIRRRCKHFRAPKEPSSSKSSINGTSSTNTRFHPNCRSNSRPNFSSLIVTLKARSFSATFHGRIFNDDLSLCSIGIRGWSVGFYLPI